MVVKVEIDGEHIYEILSFFVPADDDYTWLYFLDKSGLKVKLSNFLNENKDLFKKLYYLSYSFKDKCGSDVFYFHPSPFSKISHSTPNI